MVATARWMYRSAQARTETRGMHRRAEYKLIDAGQRHRLISGGLDDVWVSRKEVGTGLVPAEHQGAHA